MNIILLGYPGSGKGTQAETLCAEFGIEHISTGDMFRDEISKNTPLGLKVSEYLSGGKLVDDKTVLETINKRLEKGSKGFLFDGFPRTLEQAESLDGLLASKKMEVDAVVFLKVNEADVVERMSSRRICAKCGKVYNIVSNPSQKENLCDACGGELLLRDDDKPAVIEKRLMVYRDLTEPLISYYRANGVFHEVQAIGEVEDIAKRIISLVKNG